VTQPKINELQAITDMTASIMYDTKTSVLSHTHETATI